MCCKFWGSPILRFFFINPCIALHCIHSQVKTVALILPKQYLFSPTCLLCFFIKLPLSKILKFHDLVIKKKKKEKKRIIILSIRNSFRICYWTDVCCFCFENIMQCIYNKSSLYEIIILWSTLDSYRPTRKVNIAHVPPPPGPYTAKEEGICCLSTLVCWGESGSFHRHDQKKIIKIFGVSRGETSLSTLRIDSLI